MELFCSEYFLRNKYIPSLIFVLLPGLSHEFLADFEIERKRPSLRQINEKKLN